MLTNWPGNGSEYQVSLVAPDGSIAAQAQETHPWPVTCGPGYSLDAPEPPGISASDSHVYLLDGGGDVHALASDGTLSSARFTAAGGPHRWTYFSVSPDDSEVAATVVDYNPDGSTTTSLFVEPLHPNADAQLANLRFQQTDNTYTLRPVGWHAGQVVLAKIVACPGKVEPQYWALELHLVDPATAVRRLTMGGPDCVIEGPPSAGGVLCENDAIDFIVRGWDNRLKAQEPSGLAVQSPAYVSLDGALIAVPGPDTTRISNQPGNPLSMSACGWIDDSHLLGTGGQGPATVGDLGNGAVATLKVAGFCAGRIPGGL